MSQTLNLLQQLFARIKAKSPKLFRWIGNLALICAVITSMPEAIAGITEPYGIILPEWFEMLSNVSVGISSLVIKIITMLTVDTPVATQNVLTDITYKDKND